MKEGGLILLRRQEESKKLRKNQRGKSTDPFLRKPSKQEKLKTEESAKYIDFLLTNMEKVKDVLQRQKSRALIINRRN